MYLYYMVCMDPLGGCGHQKPPKAELYGRARPDQTAHRRSVSKLGRSALKSRSKFFFEIWQQKLLHKRPNCLVVWVIWVEHRGNADDHNDELAGDAVCQPLDVRFGRLPRKGVGLYYLPAAGYSSASRWMFVSDA